ncbi:MAG: NAD(P)/FAD-dependent oxidoreductase, partial [Pontimonas sp.]|nr:NAD(P)/FAD-dependent oxidoreductase [Pontimonas sp.]
TGLLAWFAHRFYHGFAIPMWERKARVFSNWLVHFFWGRDFSSVRKVQRPRDFFEEFASRPAEAPKKATRQKVGAR